MYADEKGEEQRADLQIGDLCVYTMRASRAGALNKMISFITTISFFRTVTITADVAISVWTGESSHVLDWWFPVDMKLHQVFVMFWFISPFTDLTETVNNEFVNLCWLRSIIAS